MEKKHHIIREIFTGENDRLSSKRVFGGITIICVLICIIILVIKDGSTQVVENLLTTAMFLGASLLGISSITGIWKKPIYTTNNTTNINNTQNNSTTTNNI